MNPWFILLALVGALAAGGGGFVLGQDHAKASQADKEQAATQAVQAANDAWAKNVATLKPQITTIHNKLEKEIETHTVYSDCKLSPDGLQLLNAALVGTAEPASRGKLPGPDPASQ